MPIEEYWEIEKELKEANYLLASGESAAEVTNAYKKIYQRASRFAVKEKDRTWLHDKLKS